MLSTDVELQPSPGVVSARFQLCSKLILSPRIRITEAILDDRRLHHDLLQVREQGRFTFGKRGSCDI